MFRLTNMTTGEIVETEYVRAFKYLYWLARGMKKEGDNVLLQKGNGCKCEFSVEKDYTVI